MELQIVSTDGRVLLIQFLNWYAYIRFYVVIALHGSLNDVKFLVEKSSVQRFSFVQMIIKDGSDCFYSNNDRGSKRH